MQMIKVAIIGVGGYAQQHLNYYFPFAEQGLIQLVAAVVVNPWEVPETQARLREIGTKIYASTEEMYASEQDLDIVSIPTGIASHYSLSRQAIEHNCNVLVEKPLCGSLHEGHDFLRLEQEARSRGLFIAVGFQHIYAPEIQLAKQLILNGTLGHPKTISVLGLWPRNDDYYGRNNWAGKLHDSNGTQILDSPASNAFAHYLNIPLFLAGERFAQTANAREISAGLYRARPSIESFDSCAICLKTETGTVIRTFFSHACKNELQPHLILEAEHGTFEWQLNGTWRVTTKAPRYDGEQEGDIYTGIAVKPHLGMFHDVLARIKDGSRFICTPQMAFPHLCVIENLHRHFAIRNLPASVVQRNDETKVYEVQNLEQSFYQAFQGKDLFQYCTWAGEKPAFKSVDDD